MKASRLASTGVRGGLLKPTMINRDLACLKSIHNPAERAWIFLAIRACLVYMKAKDMPGAIRWLRADNRRLRGAAGVTPEAIEADCRRGT
jgi:hypothetical protein